MCKVGRMGKYVGLAVFVLGVMLCSCGDNSRDCGPGTVEEGGACLPAATCGFGTREDPATGQCVPDGSVVCTDGTVFDTLTGQCKIDPNACQNGTVLIDGACVDPTADLVIDVQEGPEPNGLGIVEASDAQAGNIVLPAAGGDPFVVHGTIDPWRDLNNDGMLEPDVDTYVLTVTAATFLRMTADGVGGTAAGFVAVASVDDPNDVLADWERVGLSLVSDTSVREVLLPRAGTYHIAIGDTRTLVEYVTAGFATTAPGGDTAEYYVSLAPATVPTAMALPVNNGVASISGSLPSDKIAIYSVPLGTGLNTVRLSMPSPYATGAFVVLRDNELAVDARETSGPARALVGDVAPTTLTRIVVDQAFTLLPTAASFSLDVTVSTAAVLSTIGGTVSATATTNVGTNFALLNLWSFDVESDDANVGMQLAWTPAIVGEIYDATGQLAASFTAPSSNVTWNSFRGVVRFAKAGRYYFAVYAPSATSSTQLQVTSTISRITPEAAVKGSPLGYNINSFRSNLFTYDAGIPTDPWQQFNITGAGGTTASWFAPALTYGRLDNLVTSAGTLGSEIPPVFTHVFPDAGGAFGHVMLSDGTQDYLVKVNATNAAGSMALDFKRRSNFVDLGSGATTLTGETLSPAAPAKVYLVRIPTGTSVTLTVTPTSNLNTQFRRVNNDESSLGALINTSTNGADVETFTQNATEWTAFVVSAAGNLNAERTFDVSVSVQ